MLPFSSNSLLGPGSRAWTNSNGESAGPDCDFPSGFLLNSGAQVIAGRLAEVAPQDAAVLHASPRRGLGCQPVQTENQTGRPGVYTHRPKASDTDKVRPLVDGWRHVNRRVSRELYRKDLLSLFHKAKPREYGDMPPEMGHYERIAPSRLWCQVQTLKQTLLGKNQSSPR